MEPLYTPDTLSGWLADHPAGLLYFSSETCSVCKVLRPRVEALIREEFPKMGLAYIDTERSPVLAGQHRVFAIPTLLLFFEGKEHARLSRNMSLADLEQAIRRPYSLVFGEA